MRANSRMEVIKKESVVEPVNYQHQCTDRSSNFAGQNFNLLLPVHRATFSHALMNIYRLTDPGLTRVIH